MGKASSAKKVARAAKAGGGKARNAGERNVVFPAALTVVVLLGLILVTYARADRQAEVLVQPIANVDHWHSSFGIYICDSFQPDLLEFSSPGGTHTHGDGLLHIHPFSDGRAGKNAKLAGFFDDAGMKLSDDELELVSGVKYKEGDDKCGDQDAIVQVAYWASAGAALDQDAKPRIQTSNFGDMRFLNDGEAFTVAFAPEGADIPLPPSTSQLAGVGADLGAIPEEGVDTDGDGEPDLFPEDTSSTTVPDSELPANGDEDDDVTTTTVDGGDADPDATTTTVADDVDADSEQDPTTTTEVDQE